MPSFVLSIADITLQLIDDAPVLPVWLTQHCQPFSPTSAPKDIAVVVHIHRDASLCVGQDDLIYSIDDTPGVFRIRGVDFEAERSGCEAPIHVRAHPEAGMAGVLRWLMGILLLERDGLFLHAMSFAREGSGVLGPGPSGRGKTTLSRLIRPHVDLFTDETTALRFIGEAPVIYATPFAGELGPVSGPASAMLDAVLLLRHASETKAGPMRHAQVVAELLGCAFLPLRHGPWMSRALTLMERLARAVPCRSFGFRPEPEVWEAIEDVCFRSRYAHMAAGPSA